MSKTRVVNQGEHMSRIEAEEGFANFHTIFDRAENAELKKKRDPHILFPGDQVFVPDRADKDEARPTDATHPFETEVPPLFLRCKVLDIDGKKVAGATCNLKIDGEEVADATTNGDGIFERRIGRLAKRADSVVHLPPKKDSVEKDPKAPFEIHIGSLNPETKLSGQQARLNNMGYQSGFTVRDLEQLLWAAEEFQCDQTKQRVLKRPKILPAPKQGEDDPENADTDSKTGIQDPALVNKIKAVHGF